MSLGTTIGRYGLLCGYIASVAACAIFDGLSIFQIDLVPWWRPFIDALWLLPFTALTAATVSRIFLGRVVPPYFRRPVMWQGALGFFLGGMVGGISVFMVALFFLMNLAPQDGQAAVGAVFVAVSGGLAGAFVGAATGVATARHAVYRGS